MAQTEWDARQGASRLSEAGSGPLTYSVPGNRAFGRDFQGKSPLWGRYAGYVIPRTSLAKVGQKSIVLRLIRNSGDCASVCQPTEKVYVGAPVFYLLGREIRRCGLSSPPRN